MEAVNLNEKLSQVNDYWSPKIIGELNDSYVKVVKIHRRIRLASSRRRRRTVPRRQRPPAHEISRSRSHGPPGEFIIVPKGVEHLPVADEEVHVVLVEPKTTLNTGNVRNERTASNWNACNAPRTGHRATQQSSTHRKYRARNRCGPESRTT